MEINQTEIDDTASAVFGNLLFSKLYNSQVGNRDFILLLVEYYLNKISKSSQRYKELESAIIFAQNIGKTDYLQNYFEKELERFRKIKKEATVQSEELEVVIKILENLLESIRSLSIES